MKYKWKPYTKECPLYKPSTPEEHRLLMHIYGRMRRQRKAIIDGLKENLFKDKRTG